jgi:AraC-like DNA-binding protein
MMFNPGDVHAPFPANDQRWSFRMFYLHDGLFKRLSQGLSETPIRFGLPFCSDPLLARKILSLHRQLQAKCEPVEFDCRILEVFEHLASRHTVQRKAPVVRPLANGVSLMREYIHAHMNEAISLEVLAGVANLSPYHALRSFRTALGLPPHKYLLQIRLERAKELLQSGKPIADIAATLGFADQSHLTRKYKAVFGVPPRQSLSNIS